MKGAAPAFTVQTAPEPRLQALVSLVAGISVTALLAGVSLHWPGAVAWMPLIPAVSSLAWHLARVQPRQLIWDGQCWRLAELDKIEEARPVRLEVLFDLESRLLLRADGRLYLPFARRQIPAQWPQLRATLHTARPHNPGP